MTARRRLAAPSAAAFNNPGDDDGEPILPVKVVRCRLSADDVAALTAGRPVHVIVSATHVAELLPPGAA